MSSLAATQADGYYVAPVDAERGRKKSKTNQFQRSGVVRLELPYDGWCTACNQHQARGLRYNAQKSQIGKYYSTPIFAFAMKCYTCKAELIMETDPEHRGYIYSGNLRRQVQDYIPEEDDGQLVIGRSEVGDEVGEQGEDAILRMQKEADEKAEAEAKRRTIVALQEHNDTVRQDDYTLNASLRKRHRAWRREEAETTRRGRRLGLPDHIRLAQPSPADAKEAQEAMRRQRRREARRQSKVARRSQGEEALRSVFAADVLPEPERAGRGGGGGGQASRKKVKAVRATPVALRKSRVAFPDKAVGDRPKQARDTSAIADISSYYASSDEGP